MLPNLSRQRPTSATEQPSAWAGWLSCLSCGTLHSSMMRLAQRRAPRRGKFRQLLHVAGLDARAHDDLGPAGDIGANLFRRHGRAVAARVETDLGEPLAN